MTFSAPSVSNVLFLLLAFLPGIFSAFFLSSGALHLSLWSLAPCGILLVRRSSSSLWPLLAGLASSRLYLLLFPLRVETYSFPTFQNSAPRRNPLLTPYLVLFVSGLYVTSWVPYRMSYLYVLCAHSRFICIVLPRFLLVLPLVLYPRMRLVSFSVVSFLFLSLLLRILLHPLLVFTSIRAISTFAAFSRNVPLSSILAAATWGSSTVFTSFYLLDAQFSSSSGFSLGPLVAADAVI